MATLSFTTTFDLSLSPKQFIFEDTSNYAGQGIATTNVNGSFRITSPSGNVIYNNTSYTTGGCDIYINNDLENQTTIQLPLGTDGLPEAGEYTILYTVYNSSAVAYYTQTNTYTYGYVRPVVCIVQTVDCVSPLFTSADTTDYSYGGITPTIVRQHTVTFPVGSGLSPETTASATYTAGANEFANGTQTTSISTSLEYTFTDDLVVRDVVTAVKEILVDCTYICSIYCGLRSLEQQMVTAQTNNPVEYQRLTMLFAQIMALVTLTDQAIKCGKSSDVNGYLTYIMALGNFTGDCCCEGDEPALVSGLGGLISQAVVVSGDATIVVDPVVAGSTTTYTVTLSTVFIALVNSLYNTAITAGYGVNSSSATVGITKTYTLSVGFDSSRLESTTPFVVPVANNTAVTGGTPTAPSAGLYLIMFEADQIATAIEDITYRLRKNGATTLGTDRKVTSSGASINKMSLIQLQTLAIGDVISVQVDSASGSTIGSRSITILRYQ